MRNENSIISLYKELQKISIEKIKKARYFFTHKYPKTLLLILSIILAYLIFKNEYIFTQISRLGNFGYISMFIAGVLLSFGFTAPLAVGFFIALQPSNIFLAAIIGGAGAFTSDMIIFKVIRTSFTKEFNRLKNEKPIKKLNSLIKENVGLKISNYLLYFFAGIIFMTPLPNEIGIAMFSGLTHIRPFVLGIVSITLNTTGIFIILTLSQMLV